MARAAVTLLALSLGFAATASAQLDEEGEGTGDSAEYGGVVMGEPPGLPPEQTIEDALASGAAVQLASEEQQALLGEWMEHTASVARRGRLFGGANQLIGTSIILGIGIGVFVSSPSTELSKGLSLAVIGAGGTFMAIGISTLATKSQAELRLERWKRVEGSRLTLRELGQFEGELRAQVETRDRTIKLSRWANFGLAMSGALILGLTPAANLSSDAATVSYVGGGILLGIGLLGFGLSFAGDDENDYEAYMRGQRPLQYARRRTVRAAPAIGRRFVGAQVIGQF